MKLPPRSEWLLRYFYARLPYGIAVIHPLPTWTLPAGVEKPDMITVRGLLNRGLIEETTAGIYELTAAGKKFAATLAPFPKL